MDLRKMDSDIDNDLDIRKKKNRYILSCIVHLRQFSSQVFYRVSKNFDRLRDKIKLK